MQNNPNKIKISVQKASSEKTSHRGIIDFVPGKNKLSRPRNVAPKITDRERTRREIAREQVSRREEIHRQIEKQNEAEILARRRADAARRELARQRAVEEEAERIRAQKELERAEAVRIEQQKRLIEERMERQAAAERRQRIAERRAEAAKRELARRQAEAKMKGAKGIRAKNPTGSIDPIARRAPEPERPAPRKQPEPEAPVAAPRPTLRPAKHPIDLFTPQGINGVRPGSKREVTIKSDENNHRIYGRVTSSPKVVTRAEEEYRALHPESLGDIDEFASEVEVENGYDDYDYNDTESVEYYDDIEEIEENIEEDTSRNNSSYVLGGKSPFINTDSIVKRPLSGNNAGIGADRLQRPGQRNKPLLGGPNRGDYVSPAESPRRRELARRAAEEFEERRQLDEEDRAEFHDRRATSSRYVPYEEPIPHKTIYARRVKESKNEKDDVPTMVVADSEKGSGAALTVVILLTIILGAIVGVIVYLAFFQ